MVEESNFILVRVEAKLFHPDSVLQFTLSFEEQLISNAGLGSFQLCEFQSAGHDLSKCDARRSQLRGIVGAGLRKIL